MWLTIASTMMSWDLLSSATSSQEQARVHLGVVDRIKAGGGASNGVKNGRTWTPSYTPAKRVRSTSVSEAMVPSPKRLA